MKIVNLVARDLPDLWFQLLSSILEHGRSFVVDRGSYEGQTRLEFDFVLAKIEFPTTEPLLPDIPKAYGLPNPVEYDYIYGGVHHSRSYVEYLMTSEKQEGESYTYGERLTKVPVDSMAWWCNENTDIYNVLEPDGKILFVENDYVFLNQIELLIDTYKKHGLRNNQMVLQIAQPSDMLLVDPPCLRHIDTRIQDNGNGPELSFHIYFRSWDLYGGVPANLAGIVEVARYIAGELGIPDNMIKNFTISSKGIHLYGYAENLAKIRCMKE